jgi:hypothetical protein
VRKNRGNSVILGNFACSSDSAAAYVQSSCSCKIEVSGFRKVEMSDYSFEDVIQEAVLGKKLQGGGSRQRFIMVVVAR